MSIGESIRFGCGNWANAESTAAAAAHSAQFCPSLPTTTNLLASSLQHKSRIVFTRAKVTVLVGFVLRQPKQRTTEFCWQPKLFQHPHPRTGAVVMVVVVVVSACLPRVGAADCLALFSKSFKQKSQFLLALCSFSAHSSRSVAG